jgi:hypothetical protein
MRKTGSDEKKPTSLERVEELSGKTVDFHNVDINDAESLDKIFKLVTNILSSFFSSFGFEVDQNNCFIHLLSVSIDSTASFIWPL